ncbi:MAG: DUF814 domain-containing protein [Desulfovibrio sp.]|nr:DUF814 domain-containing protein [Desulfovibrio sp.]
MDAHLFRRFCDALLPRLQGARLEKIQEPAPSLLVLSCYGAGSKFQLCLRYARRDSFSFVNTARITAGQSPSAAVMRLRKYLADRRIAACVPDYWQRRLWLLAGGNTAEKKTCWLLLDLREGASLHFLPPEMSPSVEEPRWPSAEELPKALQNWRQWPVLTPALRRCLVHLDHAEQLALLEDLRLGGGDIFCQSLPDRPDHICSVSAWPLPAALLDNHIETGGDDILCLLERAGQCLVLERLAQNRISTAVQPLIQRMARLERLLLLQKEEEIRLAKMLARQADALALQENLWRWPADMHAAVVTVMAGAHGPKRDLQLDARYSLRQNMERLFHTARRGQRGQEHLIRRRNELETELASLERQRQQCLTGGIIMTTHAAKQASHPMPAGDLPKNVQLFISDDGFALLRGRDARGNLAVRKLAAGHDIWLHAENGPGSHVIIRRAHAGQAVPERTLDQAGALAACKSWQREEARARILYAEVRHVKPMRNAPAGTVRMDKIFASREVPVDHSLETRLEPKKI